jgi:hypothetical protein
LQVGRAKPAPNKASAAVISSDQLLFPTDRETSLLFRLHTPRRLHAWSRPTRGTTVNVGMRVARELRGMPPSSQYKSKLQSSRITSHFPILPHNPTFPSNRQHGQSRH